MMAEWNSALRLTFLLRERPRQSEVRSLSLPPLAGDGEKKDEERPRRGKNRAIRCQARDPIPPWIATSCSTA